MNPENPSSQYNKPENGNKDEDLVHNVEKLVGVPEHQMEQASEDLERYFTDRGVAPIDKYEIEKSERDIEILDYVENTVDEICRKYDKETDKIPLAKIHLLRPGGVNEYTQGNAKRGSFAPLHKSFIIDRGESDVEFAQILFHEMIHCKSYGPLQVTRESEAKPSRLEAYRNGFAVVSRDGDTVYFHEIDEAITSLLEQRFIERAFEERNLFNQDEFDTISESQEDEREKFSILVDQIYEKNKGSFEDKDEIVELFIRAHITGRLLPVARLVESTFGKGSFRKIGENSKKK